MAGVRMDHLAEYLSWAAETWVAPLLKIPGGEGLVALGGPGVPTVPEFAVCEVAAALGLSQPAASGLCADVLDLAHRLPRVAAGVRCGHLEWGRARLIARRTRDLGSEQAGLVEASVMATRQTGRGSVPVAALVPFGRLKALLDQAIVRVRGPESLAEAEARVAQTLFVECYRSEDGATDLAARLAAADAARLDARLDQVAGWLAQVGDDRPKAVLRAVALGLLADPAMLRALDGLRRQHTGEQPTGPLNEEPAGCLNEEPAVPLNEEQVGLPNAELNEQPAGPLNERPPAAVEPPPDDAARQARADVLATSPGGEPPPEPDDPTDPDPVPRPGGVAGLPPPVLDKVAGMRSTVLYVHLDQASATWSAEGVGVLSRAQAEAIVGHSRVMVRPILDLAAELTYTGYTVPPLLHEQLALLNAGHCCFPGCGRRARLSEADHRDPHPGGRRGWADAERATTGTTSSSNMQPLCKKHHRAKTHARWRVLSPARGIWVWTSPGNASYLVTNGTTTPLNGAGSGEAAARRRHVSARSGDGADRRHGADRAGVGVGVEPDSNEQQGWVATGDEHTGYMHPSDQSPEQAEVTYGYVDTA